MLDSSYQQGENHRTEEAIETNKQKINKNTHDLRSRPQGAKLQFTQNSDKSLIKSITVWENAKSDTRLSPYEFKQ